MGLAYLLTVLKLSPFKSSLDDMSMFSSSLSLCLTTIAAIMLKAASESKEEASAVDAQRFGYFIVGISTLTGAVDLTLMFASTDTGARWLSRYCGTTMADWLLGK